MTDNFPTARTMLPQDGWLCRGLRAAVGQGTTNRGEKWPSSKSPSLDRKSNLTSKRSRSGRDRHFISAALAQTDRDKALSVILGRLQHELREAYGAENARKVLQAIILNPKKKPGRETDRAVWRMDMKSQP
jgi:hypothetical protein